MASVDVFKGYDSDQILDYVYEELRLLLNRANKLPSFDKYLETLRWQIWNKYGNRCDNDIGYLIMDGLYRDEYTQFKQIVKMFKEEKDRTSLDEKLKQIGIKLFSLRGGKSLSIAHYSFHGYINILLSACCNEYPKSLINEIHWASLHLDHAFSGIGDWVN